MAILDVHQSPEITALLFGDFELRLDSGELLRSGVQVKLRPSHPRFRELLRCANLEDDSV